MRITLFAACAAALAAGPALADNGQVFDWGAQQRAFGAGPVDPPRCFDGKAISGANRSGLKTLYVQSGKGPVYDLQLRDGCKALNAAEAITVRSGRGGVVCEASAAELVLRTADGPRRCDITSVRRLSVRETEKLARAAGR